jgi:hypothetical protein
MAYIKPNMFGRTGKFFANTVKGADFGKIKKPIKYGIMGTGGAMALGLGALGAGSAFTKGVFGVANKTMRGILPNTYYPAASGMFGTRTSTQAGPAGIEGLKFNFRRR